ncbi:Uncharacterised protein [Vibrio cholerae]|nr:Uncharacterised protein [Vibrio cholerae]
MVNLEYLPQLKWRIDPHRDWFYQLILWLALRILVCRRSCDLRWALALLSHPREAKRNGVAFGR